MFFSHVKCVVSCILSKFHDVSQVAAITVGKDMSIRELQQGAWRMRGLAKGQCCEILLPEEVAVYMRQERQEKKTVEHSRLRLHLFMFILEVCICLRLHVYMCLRDLYMLRTLILKNVKIYLFHPLPDL